MSATGYIADNRQRTSADITINYYVGGIARTISVPITPRSTRRFMLMQDDYIQLEFSLADAVNFGIGSYISDQQATYYITTEQMPRYNQQTGGYDYSLRFDADYYRWRNYLHCLVANNKRMETSWSMTDKLAVHAQQIADNANIIFPPTVTPVTDPDTGTTYYRNSGYGISVDAENAADIKYLQYNGMNIIDAMNAIAEAYGCEWWVDNEQTTIGSTIYAHTIHFGKCQLDNTPFVFSIGDNVEGMDIARDQQTLANRIYAYGGTHNIPDNYDRRLIFTADTVTQAGTGSNRRITSVKDSTRELTLEMIEGEGTVTPTAFAFGLPVQGGTNSDRTYTQTTATKQLSGNQTFVAQLEGSLTIINDDWAGTDIPQVSVVATLHYGLNTKRMNVLLDDRQLITDGKTWSASITMNETINLGASAVNVYADIVWSVVFQSGSAHTSDHVDCGVGGSLTATADASTATKDVIVTYDGTEYGGTFSGATGIITFGTNRPPYTFANKQYTVSPLNLLKVPMSFYTFDYSTGTMRMAGEKRLHLPLADYPNRYVDTDNMQDVGEYTPTLHVGYPSQVIEEAVVFEDVFPKLTLRIKAGSIVETEKKQRIDYSDNSVKWEDWTQYSFMAEYNDNGTWKDFPFKQEYMLDGNKLQTVFSAPTSSEASGHLLSGMTFDVGLTQLYNGVQYTIIRNEDYGVLLPNKALKPTEHDEFVLTGWNPVALNQLGIVDAAERELATKAEEYLKAVQEGQYTINVHMMSDVFFTEDYGGGGDDNNGNKMFGLLALGASVTVNNAALPGGSKTSRIIGYEYKLDIPYDTPTYIVGETEAFSRLRQIEKKLNRL